MSRKSVKKMVTKARSAHKEAARANKRARELTMKLNKERERTQRRERGRQQRRGRTQRRGRQQRRV